MVWAVAAVAVLWLAIAYPSFRRVLAVLFGLASLAAVVVVVVMNLQERQRSREQEEAKTRIPMSEIEPFDLRMETESSFATFSGRVRNNNKTYTRTGIEFRIRIRDCRQDAVKTAPDGLTREQFEEHACDIVGDATEQVTVSVPPGQVREFSDHVSFPGVGSRPSNTLRNWEYELVSVSGRMGD